MGIVQDVRRSRSLPYIEQVESKKLKDSRAGWEQQVINKMCHSVGRLFATR